jgi:hypothetical protein
VEIIVREDWRPYPDSKVYGHSSHHCFVSGLFSTSTSFINSRRIILPKTFTQLRKVNTLKIYRRKKKFRKKMGFNLKF